MKKGILRTKKSLKSAVLLCLIGVMVVTSCSNDDDSDNTTASTEPVVYVAGFTKNSGTKNIAAIWKDGELTKLTDAIDNTAQVNSIFVKIQKGSSKTNRNIIVGCIYRPP